MSSGVDSLKVRIPMTKVNVLKFDLTDYYGEINATSGSLEDIDPETFKRKRFKISSKGITTSYLIQKGGNKSTPQDMLLIMFNSKLLKERYLEGITEDNIKDVFNALMEQQIASFSFDSFLDARCTDVDIKIDNVLSGGNSLDLQMQSVKELMKISKVSPLKRKGYDHKLSAVNVGIGWSKREVATVGSPYLKLYAKDIELVHNSHLFLRTFLGGVVEEGLTRIEGTVKDQKHFTSLIGKQDKVEFTLRNLLYLTDADRRDIIKKMASKHIEQGGNFKRKKDSEWGLTEMFCLAFLVEGDIKSLSLAKAKIGKYSGDKQQAYRGRIKIEEVWRSEVEETEQGRKGEQLDKVFGSLGIGENEIDG